MIDIWKKSLLIVSIFNILYNSAWFYLKILNLANHQGMAALKSSDNKKFFIFVVASTCKWYMSFIWLYLLHCFVLFIIFHPLFHNFSMILTMTASVNFLLFSRVCLQVFWRLLIIIFHIFHRYLLSVYTLESNINIKSFFSLCWAHTTCYFLFKCFVCKLLFRTMLHYIKLLWRKILRLPSFSSDTYNSHVTLFLF